MTRALLALGSNVGDRERLLAGAREGLERAGVAIVQASTVMETEPIGVTDQPRFLNQVLAVETTLPPRQLLETVKRLEGELGRTPGPRWGPREIDIDILRYNDRQVDEPGLRIPHPELPNRAFLQDLLREIGAG